MIPVYKILLKRGLSILIYSGDVDAIVPVRAPTEVFNALPISRFV